MVRSANEDACLHASTYKSTTSAEWGILRSVDTFKLSLLPRFPNRAGRAGECLVRIRRPDRFVRTVEEIRLKRGSSELQSKSTTGHKNLNPEPSTDDVASTMSSRYNEGQERKANEVTERDERLKID
ncbi:hypothetical protein F2P81_013352 [Scophthalmus maximus]|uniref:Uncharacterized protein n=1 Tax=Scophthalmus maximus TaxID=52904 RepID=A0A6A4SWX2_SCOMX|nr:hypothetical protein F2P81_013352 [Scophthalmus maximus]